MTIIGFEFRDKGNANLLVFDPMFKTSPAIQRLIGKTIESSDPTRLLKAYRRGEIYLRKYKAFEILKYALPSSRPRSSVDTKSTRLSSLNINQENRASKLSSHESLPTHTTGEGGVVARAKTQLK
jgi:Peptidase family C78